MGDWGDIFDLLELGTLYSVGQTLTATGSAGAQFALWNPGLNRVLWVVVADVSAAAAMEADLFLLKANPSLTAGNTPGPLSPDNQTNATASFQAAVAAQPTTAGQWGAVQLGSGGVAQSLKNRPIRLANGFGLLVSSAAIAGAVSLSLVWAELLD